MPKVTIATEEYFCIMTIQYVDQRGKTHVATFKDTLRVARNANESDIYLSMCAATFREYGVSSDTTATLYYFARPNRRA